MSTDKQVKDIAIAYLLNGQDDWDLNARRFLNSYQAKDANRPHHPYVLITDFTQTQDKETACSLFQDNGFKVIELDHDGVDDITAYAHFARQVTAHTVGFFNRSTEILSQRWLAKFMNNLTINGYDLVGAMGSFEGLNPLCPKNCPNVHIKTNAFFLNRRSFLACYDSFDIKTNADADGFERGVQSLTNQIMKSGGRVAIVGKDAQAFRPERWPFSETYHQGTQSNLMIADQTTRAYDATYWAAKDRLAARAWGLYRNNHFLWTEGNWLGHPIESDACQPRTTWPFRAGGAEQ